MIVKQLKINNALRNYNYIIACPETLEAAVIDPLNAELCLSTAKEAGWEIKHIFNTHEHWDHIAGNDLLQNATGAKIYTHIGNKNKVPSADIFLLGNESISIGNSINLIAIDTPGHTFGHICLLSEGENPALFSGDTLFNTGCGNCRSGCVHQMYESLLILKNLAPQTTLYPGHDYIENNLNFSLSILPQDKTSLNLQKSIKKDGKNKLTTLEQEIKTSLFFRLNQQELIEKLIVQKLVSSNPSEKEIFIALRSLRDKW